MSIFVSLWFFLSSTLTVLRAASTAFLIILLTAISIKVLFAIIIVLAAVVKIIFLSLLWSSTSIFSVAERSTSSFDASAGLENKRKSLTRLVRRFVSLMSMSTNSLSILPSFRNCTAADMEAKGFL